MTCMFKTQNGGILNWCSKYNSFCDNDGKYCNGKYEKKGARLTDYD